MKLCVQPAEFGWEAGDVDSYDGSYEDGAWHYSGQYAHGNTREEALTALREIYEDFLDGDSKACSREEAIEAIAWIDARIADTFFKLAKAICAP